MRQLGIAAAVSAVLAALPGSVLADTIAASTSVDLQANALYESGDIVLNPGAFNSSLGTLTGTVLTFSGEFTPGLQWQTDPDLPPGEAYPESVPVTLTGNVGIGGPGEPRATLPAETASAVHYPNGSQYGGIGDQYVAIGTAEPFTVSDDLGPGNPIPGPTTLLAWTSFAQPANLPASGFGDLLHIHGTLTAAYTYTPVDLPSPVPEPASLALLELGLLALIGARRR